MKKAVHFAQKSEEENLSSLHRSAWIFNFKIIPLTFFQYRYFSFPNIAEWDKSNGSYFLSQEIPKTQTMEDHKMTEFENTWLYHIFVFNGTLYMYFKQDNIKYRANIFTLSPEVLKTTTKTRQTWPK